jgi:Tol biopolymer transport system component
VRALTVLAAALFAATSSLLLAEPASATFHGKNGRIAFSLDTGDGAQIYTMRRDGTDRRQLTNLDGIAVDPDWSPNGRRIVFEVDHPNESGCSVEIMRADGSKVRDLTGSRSGCERTPAFTPGGHRILFARDCDTCAVKIKSMNLRGGDRNVVIRASGGLYYKEPQVSPDGRWVVFLSEKSLGVVNGVEQNRKALKVVRMNGSHVHKIVPYRLDVCACGGDWSPNGKWIEFSDHAGCDGCPQTKPMNVRRVHSDGSGMRFVTHFQTMKVLFNGSYSPSGRWILYRIDKSEERHPLWKIHPDGTNATRIARFKLSPGTRDWGPRPE